MVTFGDRRLRGLDLAGDSGGPVYELDLARGLLKGVNGTSTTCNFYFYMPLDYLPSGWSLLT